MKPKPTKTELRAAVVYARKQFRTMFPERCPQHHPKYREVVLAIAQLAAELRASRLKLAGGRRSGKKDTAGTAAI